MTTRKLPADLDLDAVAAEAAAESWTVVLHGERFTMPGDLAAEAIVAYGRWAEIQREAEGLPEEEANLVRLSAVRHMERVTALLFGSEEDYARFVALRPSEPQRQALVLEAMRRVGGGAEVGEASDSRQPSPGSGRPARRTASGSTG